MRGVSMRHWTGGHYRCPDERQDLALMGVSVRVVRAFPGVSSAAWFAMGFIPLLKC